MLASGGIHNLLTACNKHLTPALSAGRYAYLEKQLEAKDTNGEKENGSSHKREKKERHEKSRDRGSEKDRKSSKREHRDGSRDRERKRHHSSHEHSRTEKERKHRSPERRCGAARLGRGAAAPPWHDRHACSVRRTCSVLVPCLRSASHDPRLAVRALLFVHQYVIRHKLLEDGA